MIENLIGFVTGTYRYPIAGMAGEECPDGIQARKHSIVGDRVLGLVRESKDKNGDEFLQVIHTKDRRDLLKYQPRFVDPSNPRESRIVVLTPHGREYYAGEEELRGELSAVCRANVRLLKLGKNLNYSGAFAGISHSSIEAHTAATNVVIAEQEDDEKPKLEQPLDQARFRMNVTFNYDTLPVDPAMNKEAHLVGDQLRFGNNGPLITVWEEAERCAAINYAVRNGRVTSVPQILKAFPQGVKPQLGFYAGIDKNGLIRKGDAIYTTKENPTTTN